MTFYAHSIEGKPLKNGICLRSTRGLSPAKRRVAQFAAEFGCGEWGYLAGLWHETLKKWVERNKISPGTLMGVC